MEAIYKSSWCKAEPLVYERNIERLYERFMNKITSYKHKRVLIDEGRYIYFPSEMYRQHFVKVKKIS